ncbi:Hemolymph lipopolysaccharide-binding protein [Gryllus bimaculatus]|nr:Hemolymph lipopolysaccharide-binding protein [Gryllus bimaculatus]
MLAFGRSAMQIKNYDSRRRTILVLLLVVQLVVLTPGVAQVTQTCSFEKLVTISLDVKSNASGPTIVHGRVEQLASNTQWTLGVEFGATMCSGADQPRSKVMYFTLTERKTSQAATLPADTAARKLLPPGYTWRAGVDAVRASAAPLAWGAARAACEAEGALLATVSSPAEARLLWRVARELEVRPPAPAPVPGVWYGASDHEREAHFLTVAGVPLNDTGFASFQALTPNGGKQENCLFMNKDNGLLDDGVCDWLLGYICKHSL